MSTENMRQTAHFETGNEKMLHDGNKRLDELQSRLQDYLSDKSQKPAPSRFANNNLSSTMGNNSDVGPSFANNFAGKLNESSSRPASIKDFKRSYGELGGNIDRANLSAERKVSFRDSEYALGMGAGRGDTSYQPAGNQFQSTRRSYMISENEIRQKSIPKESNETIESLEAKIRNLRSQDPLDAYSSKTLPGSTASPGGFSKLPTRPIISRPMNLPPRPPAAAPPQHTSNFSTLDLGHNTSFGRSPLLSTLIGSTNTANFNTLSSVAYNSRLPRSSHLKDPYQTISSANSGRYGNSSHNIGSTYSSQQQQHLSHSISSQALPPQDSASTKLDRMIQELEQRKYAFNEMKSNTPVRACRTELIREERDEREGEDNRYKYSGVKERERLPLRDYYGLGGKTEILQTPRDSSRESKGGIKTRRKRTSRPPEEASDDSQHGGYQPTRGKGDSLKKHSTKRSHHYVSSVAASGKKTRPSSAVNVTSGQQALKYLVNTLTPSSKDNLKTKKIGPGSSTTTSGIFGKKKSNNNKSTQSHKRESSKTKNVATAHSKIQNASKLIDTLANLVVDKLSKRLTTIQPVKQREPLHKHNSLHFK